MLSVDNVFYTVLSTNEHTHAKGIKKSLHTFHKIISRCKSNQLLGWNWTMPIYGRYCEGCV